jgi:tetratricopeptide (TPR) repeat protein
LALLTAVFFLCTIQHEDAARNLEKAIRIQKSRLGDCDKVAVNVTNLGEYHKASGDTEKALEAYTNALRILEGKKSQQVVLVRALLGLADLLNSTGEYNAALGHYNDCLNIQKSLFSETHEDVATTLYLTGMVAMNQGHYAKALGFLTEAVDVMTALNDEVNAFNGDAYNMMGFVEMKNGNPDSALRRFYDALHIRRALGKHMKEAEALKNIGNVYREKNEYDLALDQYEECLSIITEEEGRDSEAIVDILIAMGDVTSDKNFHDDAMSHYKNGKQHQPFILNY